MNAGLPQGFVRFGTLAHRILVYIHEVGEASQTSIQEDLDLDPFRVGMNLTRLRRHRFLRCVGKLDPYVFNCRTQKVYIIWTAEKPNRKYWAPVKSAAERTREYRRRLKENQLAKVTSVFDLAKE